MAVKGERCNARKTVEGVVDGEVAVEQTVCTKDNTGAEALELGEE